MKLEKFMKEDIRATVPEFDATKLNKLARKFQSDVDDAKAELFGSIDKLIRTSVVRGDHDTLTWVKDNIESMVSRYVDEDTLKELLDMVDDTFKSEHPKYPLPRRN